VTSPMPRDQPPARDPVPAAGAHLPAARRRDTAASRPADPEMPFPISSDGQAEAGIGGSGEQSIFAGLRRLHPDLRVHALSKPALLAMTRAVEDECCARAPRPILLGSFQRQRFYRAAAARWADLARTAELTVVFADFEHGRIRPGPVAEVPVSPGSPLQREWVLVCDAAGHPACVTGRERPGQERCRDQDRIFEVMWSADPTVVRSAARIGSGLAAAALPDVPDWLSARLGREPGPGAADLHRASGVLDRILGYLGSASQGGQPRTASL